MANILGTPYSLDRGYNSKLLMPYVCVALTLSHRGHGET